ncbi:MAG: hypothetical protein A2513_03620 [Sulfurimonas sp. RIFOXYD12_FULL_33_39]|uniref:hypothetical protein n=1 Tax=unclassified Sulfurimonas TaxID=2623549 RepID=UPI0008B3B773|nr:MULTISPECIES: hypothetical protein [unclassified Sulfurimonas]OHE05158.1 MAG: hypothetical protein A3G74_03160 [Sulfurimonas sp. RIFCSPLOWO2_12_FULL_34_6]OHE09229.1 MAG: hypothetical protein A2513_03620 [Sulfurimonas sp. RIFOXYD12_FULL_33_39]OHE12988.1 MAG: hypothetical protein A2530_05185 [Sulfurimonas sp. RIFOXYD2_FULL_34_21]
MKKFILLFFTLTVTIYGYTYNEMLIKAQIAVFPKILLLDKKINNKLVDNKIVFIIAHEESDGTTAANIQNIFLQLYKNTLSNYVFETKTVEFSKISQSTEATAIYILNSQTAIKDLSNICASKGIITFSYDINNLKSGLMFSLMLEKNTALYINKKNFKNNKIDFIPSLYEIVKFINTQEDEQ